MKILFGLASWHNIQDTELGTERQCMGLAKALLERGHESEVSNILHMAPRWEKDFDIVHLINSSGPKGAYQLTTQIAHLKGLPVVMSPVYWPTDELENVICDDLELEPEKQTKQRRIMQWHLFGNKLTWENVDWLLPSTESEMQKVLEALKDTPDDATPSPWLERYSVIPNAIDMLGEIEPALNQPLEAPISLETQLSERFILCAATVEANKNQMRLIQAMEQIWETDPDLQLVLVGDIYKQYVDIMHKRGLLTNKNVLFIERVPPATVFALMRLCQLHCMPSFLEIPGLSNLEAAALGKKIVVSDRESIREYFGDEEDVYYCNPASVDSIAAAIKKALESPADGGLYRLVQHNYTYQMAAAKTEAVYKRLLGEDKWKSS